MFAFDNALFHFKLLDFLHDRPQSDVKVGKDGMAMKSVTLSAGDSSLVLGCELGTRPSILYWGKHLNADDAGLLQSMATRQHAPGSADQEVAASLLNGLGAGGRMAAGFRAHRQGRDWATTFRVTAVEHPSAQQVTIVCEDDRAQIRATHAIALHPDSGVLTFTTAIENLGEAPLSLEHCAAVCLPLDERTTELTGFSGRWAGEFMLEPTGAFTGTYLRENKSGRTGHDSFPGLLAGTAATTEHVGACFGFHLGWSGNHQIRVDRLNDGRAFVQMAESFLPGEVCLAPGEVYRTPALFAAHCGSGYGALSRKFHRHLTDVVMDGRIKVKPRPVHYNTWEAVYFDHDQKRLFALAEKAADVGVERFILDDGWFGGRRDDRTGLGDWWPSDDVYPDGLAPLIKHVTGLGMEFGLWFEPEMVNPDSDLYRQHPDWVLGIDGIDPVPFRGQLPLDLTRADVSDYLFERLDGLLSKYDIAYVKWDMNRDIQHPGSAGRPVQSAQTHALYTLIDRLRAAHPTVEIESCASGGGRADYGILQRTDRIWTSDSNDALDRQRIQRGASHFFPLQVMGAHVGPAKCHITGRRLSMALRVATALFGHMGLELNLLEEEGRNLDVLKAGIALHKRHRDLLHTGDLVRLDTPDHVNAVGVVAADQSEALISWCNLKGHDATLPGRLFVPGLDETRHYRTRIVWPDPVRSVSSPSALEALALGDDGTVLPGELLAQAGLQVPLLHPETCLIYHFEAI